MAEDAGSESARMTSTSLLIHIVRVTYIKGSQATVKYRNHQHFFGRGSTETRSIYAESFLRCGRNHQHAGRYSKLHQEKISQVLSLQLPWSYVPGKPSLSSRSEPKFTKHKKLVLGVHEISIDLLCTHLYITMTCLDVATMWHHKTLPTGSQFWLQDSPSLGMMTVSARNKRPRPLDRWSCACADMDLGDANDALPCPMFNRSTNQIKSNQLTDYMNRISSHC